jgi:phosphatidylserine decarboxylase
VNLEQEGKAERGMEKGYFEYGGSTVILLIKKDKLQIHQEILENSRKGTETPVRMGECIGHK